MEYTVLDFAQLNPAHSAAARPLRARPVRPNIGKLCMIEMLRIHIGISVLKQVQQIANTVLL